ncbi:hypothetical protein HanXRQr2_Chr14g0634321 [Helianthus annuus]|uniref:Uncharacterized protein n=1 Tax=Helianthus annuus TaxID=4232 RepID=A0A9K3E7J9_HELAN|nr:hypothetical protein HanXRQr2_Chr14g0634321 [Helianthus annuus]KAJ0839565.1 hypothetical protein HanPSC8_Chr14g0608351 [Helianthus annuus]
MEKLILFTPFAIFTKHTYPNHNLPFKALLIFTRVKRQNVRGLIVFQAYSRSKFQTGQTLVWRFGLCYFTLFFDV